MKIIKLRKVDSTNEYCKRLACDEAIVTAKIQTAGKGTKGRTFVSDAGGLYITVMRTLKNFDGADAFRIMINCCVAVCRTVERLGLRPVIRWANDVLVNGRKICGTLIENTLSSGNICRSIVGMGINVNNVLPPELEPIATSVRQETGKRVSVAKVRRTLVKYLQSQYTVQDYKRYVDWFGCAVTLHMDGVQLTAIAIDVEEDGRLICQIDGKIRKISSAEVSLRL